MCRQAGSLANQFHVTSARQRDGFALPTCSHQGTGARGWAPWTGGWFLGFELGRSRLEPWHVEAERLPTCWEASGTYRAPGQGSREVVGSDAVTSGSPAFLSFSAASDVFPSRCQSCAHIPALDVQR